MTKMSKLLFVTGILVAGTTVATIEKQFSGNECFAQNRPKLREAFDA